MVCLAPLEWQEKNVPRRPGASQGVAPILPFSVAKSNAPESNGFRSPCPSGSRSSRFRLQKGKSRLSQIGVGANGKEVFDAGEWVVGGEEINHVREAKSKRADRPIDRKIFIWDAPGTDVNFHLGAIQPGARDRSLVRDKTNVKQAPLSSSVSVRIRTSTRSSVRCERNRVCYQMLTIRFRALSFQGTPSARAAQAQKGRSSSEQDNHP